MTVRRIDPMRLRVELVQRGMQQFMLAARIGVAPTKLSLLLAHALRLEEDAELRARIERALGLPDNALALPTADDPSHA